MRFALLRRSGFVAVTTETGVNNIASGGGMRLCPSSVGAAMVDLNRHEAGNGGYTQGTLQHTGFSPTWRDVRTTNRT
jgi:hypothetical protein